jgi:formylglycine-generating enzyme required for sulfatase activity
MLIKTPIVVLVAAAALALPTYQATILMRPGADITERVQGPAMTTINPGTVEYRTSGEFLNKGRPVDAPLETVRFNSRLEIMAYQVTLEDYGRCVTAGACKPAGSRSAQPPSTPVTGVSFLDAQAYARWLSGTTGESWRLPSDKEWAFAAAERMRDDALRLPGGAGDPASRWLARYRLESAGGYPFDGTPHQQGFYGVNTKGVYDLAGNVWEWTRTCYVRTSTEPTGRKTGVENCGVRVIEGRHRTYMSTFIRDGRSGGCAAGRPPDNLGFRLVRERSSFMSMLQGWLNG